MGGDTPDWIDCVYHGGYQSSSLKKIEVQGTLHRVGRRNLRAGACKQCGGWVSFLETIRILDFYCSKECSAAARVAYALANSAFGDVVEAG